MINELSTECLYMLWYVEKPELNNKKSKSQFNIIIWLETTNILLETMNKTVSILIVDVNIHCSGKQFVAVTHFFTYSFSSSSCSVYNNSNTLDREDTLHIAIVDNAVLCAQTITIMPNTCYTELVIIPWILHEGNKWCFFHYSRWKKKCMSAGKIDGAKSING